MTVLGLLLAVVLSAGFSGLETGLYATSRLRIVLDAAAGDAAARRLQRMLVDLPRLLTVLLLANNICNWAASLLAQVVLEQAGVAQTALVGTVLVTGVLFVFGESAPKSAFRRGQHRWLYPASRLLAGAWCLLSVPALPVARLASWLGGRVQRRARAEPPARRDRRRDTELDLGVQRRRRPGLPRAR